ncbi:hypothetical protein HDR59_04640 [bacterium]|nr:hypothetical protein [bacterium]
MKIRNFFDKYLLIAMSLFSLFTVDIVPNNAFVFLILLSSIIILALLSYLHNIRECYTLKSKIIYSILFIIFCIIFLVLSWFIGALFFIDMST